MLILVLLATLLMVGAVLWVILYAFVQGIPNFNASLFAWESTARNPSLTPALINTLIIAFMALLYVSGKVRLYNSHYGLGVDVAVA